MSKKLSYLIMGGAVSGILIVAVLSSFGRTWQDSLIDKLFLKKVAPTNITIIDIDEMSIRQIGQWPWPRAIFAQLIDRLQNAKAIGIDVNFKETSHLGAADDQVLGAAIARSKPAVILSSEMQPDGQLAPSLPALTASGMFGFPNIIIAPDGVARVIRFRKNGFDSFALKLADNPSHVPAGSTRIAYAGPDRSYKHISVRDILAGTKVADNNIVLIGATAADLQDYHLTPFGLMSGVEIQANIISTLQEANFYSSSIWLTIFSIILLSALTLWLSVKIHSVFYKILSGLLLMVLYTGLALISFDYHFILDLLFPNVAILLSLAAATIYQYQNTSKERRFIHDSFSHYLAPQVINELMADPSKLALGGRKAELSILFSDIRGFTTMSEALPPEQLTHFLNQYLTVMTDLVMDHEGLVDKYIGDAIMAFWGAPVANSRHAVDAVRSAKDMIKALHDFNAQHESHGDPTINVGIGINTGVVTVGNMGSEKRFDYTVMGDNVNLASRLESLSKTYGVNIIIGQQTYTALPEAHGFLIRELDQVQVKGKKTGVKIYEVVPDYYEPQVNQILNDFNAGREFYYKGQWDQAIEVFEKVLTKVANDGSTKLLLKRCQQFKSSQPLNWQGVYEFETK